VQVKHAKADRKDADAVKEAVAGKNFDGDCVPCQLQLSYSQTMDLTVAYLSEGDCETLKCLHIRLLQWCMT
jgi:hypothetical protein